MKHGALPVTTINVDHMLFLASRLAGNSFRHTLPELATHLRELRDRSRASPSEAVKACEEFFALYVFSDAALRVHPTMDPHGGRWVCGRCESVNRTSDLKCAGCNKDKPGESPR
jgi:hypothetical protein